MSKKFLAVLGLCAPLCWTLAITMPNLVVIALFALFGNATPGSTAINAIIGGSGGAGGLFSLLYDGGVGFFGLQPHTGADFAAQFGQIAGGVLAL